MTRRLFLWIGLAVLALAVAPALGRPDWYIAGESGSDLNPATASAPRKTFPADAQISTNDRFFCAENIRSTFVTTGKVVHISQWAGMPQAWVRGDTIVPATGWAAAGNGWSINIGAGLQLNNTSTNNDAGTANLGTVVVNWDTKISADGGHYGHMEYATAAAVQAASGATTGLYHYSNATGLLTIFAGGLNPNNPGCVVAYCNTANTNAIRIIAGSGSTVTGLRIALFPNGDGNGYAVRFEGCVTGETVARDCFAYDTGYHAFGGVTKAKLVKFIGCEAILGWRGSTLFVFHTDDNLTTVTGCVMERCRVLSGRFRNFAGTGVPGGIDAAAQYGLLCHGPGGGNPLVDVLVVDPDFIYGETGFGFDPVSGSDLAAVGDAWSWSTYPIRVTGGRCVNANKWHGAAGVAVRQMRIKGPASGIPSAPFGFLTYSGTGAGPILYEACEIIADGIDGNFRVGTAWDAGHDLRFLNCSIHQASTAGAAKYMFGWNYSAAFIRARGSVFDQTAGGTASLCINDSTTDAAHREIQDCMYRLPGGSFSGEHASFDTQAEWVAAVDTVAKVKARSPFLFAPGNLSLTVASVAWGDRRTTSTIVPAAGLHTSAYRAFYGCYQYARRHPRRRRFDHGAQTVPGRGRRAARGREASRGTRVHR